MSEVAGSSSKSLLLQTVALFEALLARFKGLQAELGARAGAGEFNRKQVEEELKGKEEREGERDGVGNKAP